MHGYRTSAIAGLIRVFDRSRYRCLFRMPLIRRDCTSESELRLYRPKKPLLTAACVRPVTVINRTAERRGE